MSKKLKKKSLLLVLLAVISMVVLGFSLNTLHVNLSLENYRADMKEELSQVSELMDDASAEEKNTIETYDAIYQAKADAVSFMAQNEEDFAKTDSNMKSLCDLLDVDNVLLLDPSGNVIAKAKDSDGTFTRSRFNQLRSVFSSHSHSDAFEVSYDDETYRYYGSYMDDETMVVVEQDPEELDTALSTTVSQKAVLSKINVGLNGYTFSISANNYMVLYHPDEDLIGVDALTAGIPVEDLEDGNFGWFDINGQKVYAGISLVDDTYYISAVPQSEIESSRSLLLSVVLFIFFSIMTIVILYGIFVMRAEEKETRKKNNYRTYGKYTYNRIVGTKATTLSIVGLICIMVITYYMQSLTAISQQSVSNNNRVDALYDTLVQNDADIDALTQQYNERYLNKTAIASDILTYDESLVTKEKLTELANVLQIKEINVFDKNGKMIATNASYSDFSLSQDPDDQSYEFNKVLQGAEYVIQEAQTNEANGEFFQYIAMPLVRDGEIDGLVQLGIRPERLENLLSNTTIDKVLDGVRVGVHGFAFAVNKESGKFVYYPQEKMIGRKATDYGMKESQFKDGYNDFITLDGVSYFGTSIQEGKNYIYVVVPESEIAQNNLTITLATGAISFVCLICIFVVLSFTKNQEESVVEQQVENKDSTVVDVEMPDGTIKKSESAVGRFTNLTIAWDEKTPEQQIGTVIKWLFGIFALMICVFVVFKDRLFDHDSIFAYILSFEWEKGINIFAFTGSIIAIGMVMVITAIVRKILLQLSETFGTRGETICRLLISFLKYLSWIGLIFYCVSLFGVDASTLLASAGILSLVIGLGSQDLIKDILAGLFIIFEGEFRVGDIVTIGGYRGTVLEIGVRTTKVQDGNNNVKVISNSNVSDVINMTKRHSFASCDFGIEYGESLERVENILAKELPKIKKKFPYIQDGPFYKGVISLGDNSVNIRIVAQCRENDRSQLEHDLNREMKLLCDHYDISIPFPQVVVNKPTVFEKATAVEKFTAEMFVNDQKEKSQDIRDGEEPH